VSSLRSLALRGSLWTLIGLGTSQFLRLVGNLILTRMLLPEAFGLIALVSTIVVALELFSDMGIAPSIVQSARGAARDFLNTAWIVQIVRGFLIWGVASALAAPFASFYDEPALARLLIVAALAAVISGFDSTKLYTARREIALARVTMLEIGTQAASVLATLGWAYFDPSVWALVAGALVASGLRMAFSHVALPGVRNGFAWNPAAWRSLFSFGRWIFLSTILTFLSHQSDRLIFGSMVSIEALGVYFVGATLAGMPIQMIGKLAQAVVFPLYSRVLNEGRELGPTLRNTRWLFLVGSGWIFGVLVTSGPSLIQVLYDPRYEAAGWVLQVLSVGGWMRALAATNGMALLARGDSHWVAASNATKLVAMMFLISLGYEVYGFPGAVVGFAASEWFSYAMLAWSTSRIGLAGWRDDALAALGFLASAGLGTLAVARLGSMRPAWFAGAIGAATVTGIWIPVAVRHWTRLAQSNAAITRGVSPRV